MSDAIKHECAVAFLRLRKDATAYGSTDFGGTKLSLLLEKQHNRGQDGAGVVTLTLSPEAGKPAYNELKSASDSPLADLLSLLAKRRRMNETVFLGHLRYATERTMSGFVIRSFTSRLDFRGRCFSRATSI